MIRLYLTASISRTRSDLPEYEEIVAGLEGMYHVLGDVHNTDLFEQEAHLNNQQIYSKEMHNLHQADLMIAEITQPSLGVGYLIAQAEAIAKPVLCLRRLEGRLSPMIDGSPYVQVYAYAEAERALEQIHHFVRDAGFQTPHA